MRRFRAAVVGLGQIGQGYDYNLSDGRTVLTHARAYTCHEGYEFVAAVDTDASQRKRFTECFGLPAYADMGTMMDRLRPEVVSLCVPTSLHLSSFRQIVHFSPRAVLCEKPMTGTVSEAKEMLRLAEENRCSLLVNYIRRFEPGVLALRETLQRGDVGKIEKGVCWYSKGILNNGSHYIDLCRYLLGGVTDLFVEENTWNIQDSDPEPDVRICFEQAPVYFLAAREECFSVGRLELMGTAGQVLYDDFGETIRIRKSSADALFAGYRVLSRECIEIATDMSRYQWHVIDHLYRHLEAGEPFPSDGRSALKTLAVIEEIRKLCKESNP
ncbi:MAG: Gfo/Idh/MocA family oxidoreductase [Syntrophaceae bacterium]|nr:Gfo/Idh/MocA family oxidoreductase [Syntrophaceae bacterium]